ncbi:putative xylitol transport system ATP-binding protein [Shinella sp. BE166]|uniref:sugar ABC transporter ATP-binding protein n=1 Tax=Shinella sp. BE166 TaxID=3373918 RepID=UPI003EB6E57C
MTQYLVEARGVSKSFDGVPALVNGEITLAPGEVLALCGGNGAGKSTFLNILMGLLQRDEGTVRIHGREVNFRSPADALAESIAIITQELSPVPDMTAAENIFLGREPRRGGGLVDHAAMLRNARQLLAELHFDVDAARKMAQLSLAQTQLVEIARAISRNARILIMDEPTSAIGEHETQILFDAIRRLTASGVGVIYVSHRLEELFEIADRYTIFRDGRYITSGNMAEIDRRHLVELIIGHEMPTRSEATGAKADDAPILLDVEHLSHRQQFHDISLRLRAGEITGIYGLMGSGRSEFLNAVYGIGARNEGVVRLCGTVLPPQRPDRAIAAGMAMVTEDRKDTGLNLEASIRHNISMPVLGSLARFGMIARGREKVLSAGMIKRLSVRASGDGLKVAALSGGNQQKVVVARCLASQPKVLICDEPTRGIDEGAKQEIYQLLRDFAAGGGAVLVCSSEAPELLQLCGSIAIFKKGRLKRFVRAAQSDQRTLLHEASLSLSLEEGEENVHEQ